MDATRRGGQAFGEIERTSQDNIFYPLLRERGGEWLSKGFLFLILPLFILRLLFFWEGTLIRLSKKNGGSGTESMEGRVAATCLVFILSTYFIVTERSTRCVVPT